MIKATTKIETKMPNPKPALKIPSITEQLVLKNETPIMVTGNMLLFFMIISLVFTQISLNLFKSILHVFLN